MHRWVYLAAWAVVTSHLSLVTNGEPLGPSTRRGPIVISEVMYHSVERSDGQNLEFIELYNAGIQP